PSLSNLSPVPGIIGQTLTITGSNFTGTTSVKVCGMTASFFMITSDNELQVTIPSGATTGTVDVTNTKGSAGLSYSILQAPIISSFAPASGQASTILTLTGSHFTGTTAVRFNGGPAATPSAVTDTQITVAVPLGSTSGPI